MIKKIYKLGQSAREDIKIVSTQVSDIIGSTLGPAGRNYFLPTGITNDGRTIIEELRFEDEAQDQAVLAYHEIARQQDRDGGDNTSTAMFTGANIVLDIIDKVVDINIPSNQSVMELLRELDTEKDKALALLKEKSTKADSLEILKNVAMTAMEHREGADLIAEAVFKGGKDTWPTIDNGFRGKIETEVIEGLQMPLKLENDNVFNQPDRAEYQNPLVVVVNHCFEKYIEIAPFMKSMLENAIKQKQTTKNPIVIVAKQFSIPFIQGVSNVIKGAGFPIVLLSANYHNDTFQDIASFVDAKLIDTHPKKGKKITDLNITDAGTAKKIVIRAKQTQFIGGRGLELYEIDDEKMKTKVNDRVAEIRELQIIEKNQEEREQMDRRIGALLGGITNIYVDAKTTVERKYLKDKAQDAINSCVRALNDGILRGGGISFKETAEELGETSILYNALKAPYERIIQNNGGGKELDLTGVYDAYSSMKASIENAVSTVKILLTIEGIIANKEQSIVEEFKKLST